MPRPDKRPVGRIHTSDVMAILLSIWSAKEREHGVPLSSTALAVLQEAQALADGSGFVFRSARGGPLAELVISKLVRDLKIGAVPHGFRSRFRD